MTTSPCDDLFGHVRIAPSEQERRWAEQRTACWHNWLWTLFIWANLADLDDKRRAYRGYVQTHGELAARSLAQAVVKVKDASFRAKVDIELVQFGAYDEMERVFRQLMRWRMNHS